MTEIPHVPLAPAWLTQARNDHAEAQRRTTTANGPDPLYRVPELHPTEKQLRDALLEADLPMPSMTANTLIHAARDFLNHTIIAPPYEYNTIWWMPADPIHHGRTTDQRHNHKLVRDTAPTLFPWDWYERGWWTVEAWETWMRVTGLTIPDWPERNS